MTPLQRRSKILAQPCLLNCCAVMTARIVFVAFQNMRFWNGHHTALSRRCRPTSKTVHF